MAGEYGKHHRNLVADANAGNIAPAPSQSASVSISGKTTQEETFESTTKTSNTSIAQALLKVAGTVATGVGAIAEERNEITQFNKAAGIEGEQEFDQSLMSEYFLGKNTSRQVKQQALSGELQKFSLDESRKLNDFQSTDTDLYQKDLKDRFMEMTKGKDAETQALMMTAYKQNVGPLIKAQVKANNEFLLQTSVNQYAQRNMDNLAAVSSPLGANDTNATTRLEQDFLTKPDHVQELGHRALQAGTIIDSLNKGDDTFLEISKENKIPFSTEENAKIDSAVWKYTQRHSEEYAQGVTDLEGSLANLNVDDADDQIAEMQAKYPRWNSQPYVKRLKQAEVRKEKLEADHRTRMGSVRNSRPVNGTAAQKRAAGNAVLEDMMESSILPVNRDPNQGVTNQEKLNYLTTNTAAYAKQWSNANVRLDGVSMLTGSVTNILNKDFEEMGDKETIFPQLNALYELNETNPKLLEKQFATKDDYLVAMAAIESLNYGEGNVSDVHKAVERTKANQGNKNMPSGANMKETSTKIADTFIESMDGYFEMQDNAAQGSVAIADRAFDIYTTELEANGGNTRDAELETRRRLQGEFRKVHGKFFGGADSLGDALKAGNINASVEDLVTTFSENEEFMNKLGEVHGLDPDLTLLDSDGHSMSYSPIRGLTLHGKRKDGSVTAIPINLPSNDQYKQMQYANEVRDRSGFTKMLVDISLWNDLRGMAPEYAQQVVSEADRYGNPLGLANVDLDKLRVRAGMAEPEQQPSNVPAASPNPQTFSEETLKQTPLTQDQLVNSPHLFYGNEAIAQVEAREGELTMAQKRVVGVEGFVSVPYLDSKDVPTIGVGQTKEYMGKTFKESFKIHEDKTRKFIPKYDNLPPEVQAELVQATYRGDLGGSPKFVELFNQGKYKEAADEFLDNDEYRETEHDGIKDRMKAVAKAVRSMN